MINGCLQIKIHRKENKKHRASFRSVAIILNKVQSIISEIATSKYSFKDKSCEMEITCSPQPNCITIDADVQQSSQAVMWSSIGQDSSYDLVDNIAHIDENRFSQKELKHLDKLGTIFQKEIEILEIKAKKNNDIISCFYDRDIWWKVKKKLEGSEPEEKILTIDGHIEMVDLKPKAYKCRIVPIYSSPINCSFKESITGDIISSVSDITSSVKKLVTVIGKGKIFDEKIDKFCIEDIKILEGEPEELFLQGKLSIGQAAKLKKMNKVSFIELMASKKTYTINCSPNDEFKELEINL